MAIEIFEVNAYRRDLEDKHEVNEFNWELHQEAHRTCLWAFAKAIYDAPPTSSVLLVCGPSGGGKSHFLAKNKEGPNHVVLALDATLNNSWARAPYVAMAKAAGLEIDCIVCYPDRDTCMNRQDNRPERERVDESMVYNLYRSFTPPTEDEQFRSIRNM